MFLHGVIKCPCFNKILLIILQCIQERKLAAEHGFPDPINPNYEATTAMYYKVAEELLQRVQSDSSGKKVQILFATHNEDTVKHIANR